MFNLEKKRMDIKGYRIIGIILIIISAISLLFGNLIGELLPMTKGIFESSIIIFIGVLGIIFLGVGKKENQEFV
jgi:hypothetical protein